MGTHKLHLDELKHNVNLYRHYNKYCLSPISANDISKMISHGMSRILLSFYSIMIIYHSIIYEYEHDPGVS